MYVWDFLKLAASLHWRQKSVELASDRLPLSVFTEKQTFVAELNRWIVKIRTFFEIQSKLHVKFQLQTMNCEEYSILRIRPVTLAIATSLILSDNFHVRSFACAYSPARSLRADIASRLYFCSATPLLFFPPRFHFVLHKHRFNKKIARALLHCQRD